MLAKTDKGYIWTIIAAFCIGWAVVYADRTALYPLLGVIGEEFHLTGTQTGAITSAYFICYVFMQIPAGIWGDKYGLKRLLVVMFFLAGVSLLLIGILPPSYLTLLILVALHGTGGGAYFPAAMGTTMTTVPKKMRGLSSAIVSSGMSLGMAIGLAAAGPIFVYFDSWRMPFLILSVPTIILALIYQLVLRDVRPEPDKRRVPLTEIIKDKNLMFIAAASFCSAYGFWTVVTWGPTFFQTERGLVLTAAGLYTAIVAVTAIPAALTIGNSSDKYGRKKLSLILLPLAAVTVFATGYVKSLPALIVVLICYGVVGKLTWDPIEISWFSDHVSATKPQAMGTAVAFFNFCGMLSAIIAPIVSGWLRDLTGSLVSSFYLGGAIVMLGTILLIFVPETVHGPGKKPRRGF